MELQELVERSWAIRQAYHDLEVKHHDSKWTVEEDLLALSNDIGNSTISDDQARTLL